MRLMRLFFYIAKLILFVSLPANSQDITANILTRVFLIKHNDKFGSSFTIDVENRQYLITARHNILGIQNVGNVQLLRNNKWDTLTVKVFYAQPAVVDIAVLVLPNQISPSFPLDPTMANLIVAQDMYFLGFPFGLQMEGTTINYGFPIPLVKKGICSGIFPSPSKDYTIIFIDGFNNPGFSGGPIVFVDRASKQLKVAGVVSAYRHQEDKVLRRVKKDKSDKSQQDTLINTDMIIQSNTGIVIGYSIKNVIDIINKNPIGPIVTY